MRRPAARTEQREQEDPEKKVQQEKEQGVVVDSRDAPEERHDVEPGEKLQQKPARTGRSQQGKPKKKLRRPTARTEQSEQEDPEKKEQGVVADSRDAPEERHDAEEEETAEREQ